MPAPGSPPPPPSPEIQAAIDREHLRLLEIVFYIAGGMTALVSCLFLLHFALFLVMGLNPHMLDNSSQDPHNEPPPAGFFLAGAAFVGFIILLGWAFGALQIYAGRCLRHRRYRTLVMIVSGLECVFIPWGTALGVFALIALSRPSVRGLFSVS